MRAPDIGAFRRVAVAVALWTAIVRGPSAHAITNGLDAERGDAPWQIQIEWGQIGGQLAADVKDRHHCGGVLVSPSWVVTARHCLETPGLSKPGEILRQIRVRMGHIDLSETGDHVQFRHGVGGFSHGGYVRSTPTSPPSNDIALIRLDHPAEIVPRFVETVALPDSALDASWPVLIAGWGSTKEFETVDYLDGIKQAIETSYVLQLAAMRVLPRDQCISQFSSRLDDPTFELPPGTACLIANDEGHVSENASVCQGDSGGAATDDIGGQGRAVTLVGIVSWVAGCDDGPNVITDVAFFADWIKEKIEGDAVEDDGPDNPAANEASDPTPGGPGR